MPPGRKPRSQTSAEPQPPRRCALASCAAEFAPARPGYRYCSPDHYAEGLRERRQAYASSHQRQPATPGQVDDIDAAWSRLSLRERHYALNLLENGGHPYAAARAAGISHAEVRRGAMEIASRPQIRAALDAVLDACGLTLERAAEVLGEGLQATRATYVARDGVISDERHDPDHGARHRYLSTLLRLRGAEDRQLRVEESTESITYEGILEEIERAENEEGEPPAIEAEWEMEEGEEDGEGD